MRLIAIKRAFYDNRLLERGDSFEFSGDKPPKWAREPAVAGAELKAEPLPLNGDLKPKAAQAAVKRKAAGLTGD